MKKHRRVILAGVLLTGMLLSGMIEIPALAAEPAVPDAAAQAEQEAAARAALEAEAASKGAEAAAKAAASQTASEALAAAEAALASAEAAAAAARDAAAVQGTPEALAAADAAAQQASQARAVRDAAAAEAAALAQAAQEAQRQADAALAALGGQARPAPPEKTEEEKRKEREKERLAQEQLKRDIENSLEEDARDAILNGYLSLLSKDYVLRDELDLELVSIGNGHKLEERAAEAITTLVKDARSEGLRISVTSSYRTYSKQVDLFRNKIERLEAQGYTHEAAVKEAGTVVAVPRTSEHQLGLTIDFVTGSYKKLDEGIRNTREYRWVEEHAWEYGYVIRYPKGKSEITGIITEPWHLRYVGIPAAHLMWEQGICLEEFLGVAYDDQKNGISYGAGWVNTGR